LPKEFMNPPLTTDKGKPPNSDSTFIGVDGGGTKTVALAYNLKNNAIAAGIAGPSNPESVGTAIAVDSVRKAITAALTAAGSSSANVAYGVLTIAGITSDEDARTFEKKFSEYPSIYAANDVVAAWASGTMCSQGIAIIAGTGSHTIGVNEKGVYCRAGGWGHILDDEGAGYVIGLSGIKEALRAYDGRAEKTTLVEKLLQFYGISSPDDMLRLVYRENLSKDRISAFATCMAEEAVKGDAASKTIFETAGEELGLAAGAVATRLEMNDAAFPVALIGSVFLSKALVVPSLQKVLSRYAPKANIVFPSIPPVAGALLLALRAGGMWKAIDLDRFRQQVNSVMWK
jgi:N-acetylglucosamine kinase-like BadF-type ATPase